MTDLRKEASTKTWKLRDDGRMHRRDLPNLSMIDLLLCFGAKASAAGLQPIWLHQQTFLLMVWSLKLLSRTPETCFKHYTPNGGFLISISGHFSEPT